MKAKLIIRVTPDDRVQVRVEGMTEGDRPRPKGAKLCERVTRKLEADIGQVLSRRYDEGTLGEAVVTISGEDRLTTDAV